VHVPKPELGADGRLLDTQKPGCQFVFVKFVDVEAARAAINRIRRRTFDYRKVLL
jgi:hypothetical protein